MFTYLVNAKLFSSLTAYFRSFRKKQNLKMHPQRQGLGPGSDYLNFKKTLKSENYFFKTKNITECWRRNLVRYNVSIKTREPWIKIIFWQLTAKTIFLNKLFVEFSREAQKRPQADYPGERFNF